MGWKEKHHIAVIVAAEMCNARFEQEGRSRLPSDEVRSTAKMVENYRVVWPTGNWHTSAWIDRHRARRRFPGKKRREARCQRDTAIVNAILKGGSIRAVAREFGLSRNAILHILHRDAGMFHDINYSDSKCPMNQHRIVPRFWPYPKQYSRIVRVLARESSMSRPLPSDFHWV